MLQSLHIRNLALLEEVLLDFEAGFTAVTGETGAGKSILLGALSLLAGERADKTIIRQGEAACEVEAVLFFRDTRAIDGVLAGLGLPACEDGALVLRRSLPREKAPRIMVNGSLATLAALQQIGERWIDFHGPSEPRRLLKEDCQLELLDLFARAGEELSAYRGHYGAWRRLLAERERLAAEEGLSPDQVEFLRKEFARFGAVELTEEAVAKLERDFGRMSRAQELLEICQGLAAGITGDDGVQRRLALLLRDGRRLESLDAGSKPINERLAAVAAELNDLGSDVSALANDLQFDAAHAEALTARMDAWLELRRKYGEWPAVLEARDKLRRRLEAQGDIAGALERLDREIANARKMAEAAAAGIRKSREKAARSLSRTAARAIAELGFEKADFSIRIVARPDLGLSGDCGCEFLFSPNVGEAPQPLARIASSGELARVMLALKAVLAEFDGIPVLVFDEVDSNVGGEIGGVVGQKLSEIGRDHQVLCVTHLPQVAARAACHLVVTKDQSGDRAKVAIEAIQADRAARRGEIARMLGDRGAKSALAHADELLGR